MEGRACSAAVASINVKLKSSGKGVPSMPHLMKTLVIFPSLLAQHPWDNSKTGLCWGKSFHCKQDPKPSRVCQMSLSFQNQPGA